MASDGGDFARSISIATSGLRAPGRADAGDLGEYRQCGFHGSDHRRRSLSPQGPDIYLRTRPHPGCQGGRARQGQADSSAFRVKHEPSNPAADTAGNVKYPNVNPLIEMTDMRDAQRSYEANLNIISATRRMIQRTLDILKA